MISKLVFKKFANSTKSVTLDLYTHKNAEPIAHIYF